MITNKGCKRLRDLEKKVDSGGSANGALVVTMSIIDQDEAILDKTYAEIKSALLSKHPVFIDLAPSEEEIQYGFCFFAGEDPIVGYRVTVFCPWRGSPDIMDYFFEFGSSTEDGVLTSL